MSAIRTLLVDDEPLARERLIRLLASEADVEIVGEASNGEEACEMIAELKPDLVLLDIQMPGCSGIEVAASLPEPRPNIVFCTAHDEHAVDAFELHAVDYLLKPVNRARLAKTLKRIRQASTDSRSDALDNAQRASGDYPTRFLAKRRTRYCVIPRNEVVSFISEGGLTRLQTESEHYWMQPTLRELDNRLDPAHFCRISRAAIVHLDRIREVNPLAGGHGEVVMSNDETLEVSRRRLKVLMERITDS